MKQNGKYYIATNDVETTSIVNNNLSDKTGMLVLEEGLPLLLELYAQYNVKTTFFFTGYIAEKFPEVVRLVLPYGHEVGSHGYTHDVNMAFDMLSLEEQKEHLKKSKTILEDLSGQEVISFRAPAARTNKYTATALAETGFKIDSSIASQRFDFFLSFGSRQKLNWLKAPRVPYFTKEDSLWEKGNGPILEIPISAFIMPYIGTTMRLFPLLTTLLRNLLAVESSFNKKPIVFLTHPNEFINEEYYNKQNRRSKSLLGYIVGDIIRRRLKVKNLGEDALPLYNRELDFFKRKKFSFVTCKEYYNHYLDRR